MSCNKTPELDESNPFFSHFNTPFDVPPFERIMAKHYIPAFEEGMAEGRADIDKLVKGKEKAYF